MMITRSLLAVLVLGGFCAVQTFATTYVGGIENSPNNSSLEGIGDFNDMIFSLSATGLTLTDLGGGSWSALSGVTLYSPQILNTSAGTSTSDPFWNNGSLDGTSYNVGYCVEDLANCNTGNKLSIPAVNEYLSVGGAADDNFYFTVPGGGATSVQLALIAGPLSSTEVLGWYNPLNQSQYGTIFAAGTAVGTSVPFTLPAGVTTFGLWFTIPGDGYATQNGLDSLVQANSHFAMFTEAGAPSVPEPGTMVLFGIGALALGLIPRLRKRS